MSWLAAASACALPPLLGAATLRALRADRALDRLAWIAWCLLAGALCIAAILFAWTAASLPLEARFVAPAVLVATVALFAISRRRAATMPAAAASREPAASRAAFALGFAFALATALDSAVLADRRPIMLNDEAVIWAAKAKAMQLAGGLNARLPELMVGRPILSADDLAAIGDARHPDYPLLDPLLQVWAFVHRGAIAHVVNRVPIQVLTIALLLLLASALRRRCPGWIAGALLVLFASCRELQIQLGSANADALVALGLLAALDAFDRWLQGEGAAHFRLGCLGLALLVWSKNEGALLALCALAACAARGMRPLVAELRKLRIGDLALAALPLLIVLATWLVNRRFGFTNDLVTGRDGRSFLELIPRQIGARAGAIASGFADAFLARTMSVRHAPIALLVCVIAFPLRLWCEQSRTLAALALAIAGFALVYAGSPHVVEWHLETSLPRLVLQLLPLIYVALAGALDLALREARQARTSSS